MGLWEALKSFSILKFLHSWHLSVNYYRPQRSWAKVIFSQASVCPQGGFCLSACWDIPPRTRHPPGPDTHPPRTRHPRTRPPPPSRLQHTVNERPVRVLLECILVSCQIRWWPSQKLFQNVVVVMSAYGYPSATSQDYKYRVSNQTRTHMYQSCSECFFVSKNNFQIIWLITSLIFELIDIFVEVTSDQYISWKF